MGTRVPMTCGPQFRGFRFSYDTDFDIEGVQMYAHAHLTPFLICILGSACTTPYMEWEHYEPGMSRSVLTVNTHAHEHLYH